MGFNNDLGYVKFRDISEQVRQIGLHHHGDGFSKSKSVPVSNQARRREGMGEWWRSPTHFQPRHQTEASVPQSILGLSTDWSTEIPFPAGGGDFSVGHHIQTGTGTHLVSSPDILILNDIISGKVERIMDIRPWQRWQH
jgi:hypothetical protein